MHKPWQRLEAGLAMLTQQKHLWAKTKPLKGITVVHNTPLAIDTLLKVECLQQAGAQVTLTRMRCVSPMIEPEAIKMARAWQDIEYVDNQEELKDRTFDISMDCAAELRDCVHATKGIVELTRSGAIIYEQADLPVPIVSVDDSNVKVLETFFGTGEGVVRALRKICPIPPENARYLIFGYGKIGAGVANGLSKISPHIQVVDTAPATLTRARSRGLQTVAFQDTTALHQAIEEAQIIITATAIENFLSLHFQENQLKDKILATLGAHDEIGKGFPHNTVLCNGQAINFCLEQPTLPMYLDPIFCAHNVACIEMAAGLYTQKFQAFNPVSDQHLLDQWQGLYPGEDISEAFPSAIAA